MKNTSEQTFNELGKQAYLDSMNSRQAIIDKYRNKTDPILQQNDYYVSNPINIYNKYLSKNRKPPNIK